jgi:predicted metal-binding membrane protein
MSSMPGMAGHHAMPDAASAPVMTAAEAWMFLAMWAGMVVAMMMPVAVPLVAAHRFVARTKENAGARATAVFIAGYLLVWTLSGLVPLLLVILKRWLLPISEGSTLAVVGAGAVITVAGAFQFSGLKTRCLTVCRSPLSFVMTHNFNAGLLGTLRAGGLNGLYCLGCCWALMLIQVAVGLHNLVWMGALTLLFLAERALRAGKRVAMLTGAAMILLGVLLMLDPVLHTPLAGMVG